MFNEIDIQTFKNHFFEKKYEEMKDTFKSISFKEKMFLLQEVKSSINHDYRQGNIAELIVFFEVIEPMIFDISFGLLPLDKENCAQQYEDIFKLCKDILCMFFIDSRRKYQNTSSYINFENNLLKLARQTDAKIQRSDLVPELKEMTFLTLYQWMKFLASEGIGSFEENLQGALEEDILSMLNFAIKNIPSNKINEKLNTIDFSFLTRKDQELFDFLILNNHSHLLYFLIRTSWLNNFSHYIKNEVFFITISCNVEYLKKGLNQYLPKSFLIYSLQYAQWVLDCFLLKDEAILTELIAIPFIVESVKKHSEIFENIKLQDLTGKNVNVLKTFIKIAELSSSQSYECAQWVLEGFSEKNEAFLEEMLNIDAVVKAVKKNKILFEELPLQFYVDQNPIFFKLLLKIPGVSIREFEYINLNKHKERQSILANACQYGDEHFLKLLLQSPCFNLHVEAQYAFLEIFKFLKKNPTPSFLGGNRKKVSHEPSIYSYIKKIDPKDTSSLDEALEGVLDFYQRRTERYALLALMCEHGLLDLLTFTIERTRYSPILGEGNYYNLFKAAIKNNQVAIVEYLLKIEDCSYAIISTLVKNEKTDLLNLFLKDENIELFNNYAKWEECNTLFFEKNCNTAPLLIEEKADFIPAENINKKPEKNIFKFFEKSDSVTLNEKPVETLVEEKKVLPKASIWNNYLIAKVSGQHLLPPQPTPNNLTKNYDEMGAALYEMVFSNFKF